MNEKAKILAASVVVIALCLCAVGGVTYSWFSDSDSGEINVTTGKVDVSFTEFSLITSDAPMEVATDVNGVISVNKLMPGKTATVNVSMANGSDVPVKYRLYLVYTPGTPALEDGDMQSIHVGTGVADRTLFDAKANVPDVLAADADKLVVPLTAWTTPSAATWSSVFTISADNNLGGTASNPTPIASTGAAFGMKLVLQAVQADAEVSNSAFENGQSPVIDEINNTVVGKPAVAPEVAEDKKVSEVKIAFDTSKVSGATVKATQKASTNEGSSFVVAENDYVIDFEISGGSAVPNDIGTTTVTITVPGEIANPNVYYTGEGAQPQIVSSEIVDGSTVITFTTTHFSEFFVTPNVYVFNGAQLAEAMSPGSNAEKVILGDNLTDVDTFTISAKKNVTLDMNNFNIDFKKDNMLVIDGAKLDLVGTGSIVYTKNAHVYPALRVVGSTSDVADYSVVTIGKNVTIHSYGSYGAAINGPADDKSKAFGAKVIVNGTIDSTYGFSVSGNVTAVGTNTPEIIVNGEIKGSAGIYAAGYAKYIINGKLTGEEFGIEIRAGELVINEGANIIATSAFTNPVPNGNGSTVEGAAIAVSQHTTNCPIAVTINGGNIIASGANGYALFEIDTVENESADMVAKNVVINVNGGTFTGGVMSINDKIVLPAGNLLFFDKVSYVLGDASQAAAAIGVIGYKTLNDAVVAASESQTVTLLKDLTLEKTTVVDKDIAFDLNGKSLKLKNETVADFKAIAGTSVVDFNIKAGTGGLTFSPVGDVVKVAGDINTGPKEIQHHMIKLLGDADIEFDCYQENSYSITMATYGDNSISGSLMDKDGVLRGKAMMLFIVSHGTKLDLSCALKYSDVKIYTSNDLTITGNCSNSFSFDAYDNHPYVLGTFWFVNTANLTISDLTVTDGMVILTGNCNIPSGQSLNILEKARLICGYKSNYYGIADGAPVIKTGELTVAGTLKADSKPVAMPQYQTPTDPDKKICLGDSPIVVWGSGDPDKPGCSDSTIKVVSGGEVFNTGTVNNKGVFSIEDGGSYNKNAGPIELAKGVAFGPALQ